MAVTKTGSGLVAQDSFERAGPSSGQSSIAAFPGANLEIRGAVGARYLAAVPAQQNLYAIISQGKRGLTDCMIEAKVRNETIEERSGVIFRGIVPGVDMFELRLEHDQTVGKNKKLVLYGPTSVGSGSVVKLAQVPFVWAFATWYVIKAVVKGNNIRAWVSTPADIATPALIDYTLSYVIPSDFNVFGVAGGTFLATGPSLNAWDYVSLYRSNRIRMDGLPANHKIRANGVIGPVSVNGTAYLDIRGAGGNWSTTLDVLDAGNAVVASYNTLPLDPGDVFISGLVVIPGGNQFYNNFGAYAIGAQLGAPDFSVVAYLPALYGAASPWYVDSGATGSLNNRVVRPPGPWGSTSLRWLAPGTAVTQELLLRFKKSGNIGSLARLRSKADQTRGIQFSIDANLVASDDDLLHWSIGTGWGPSKLSYRLSVTDINADVGPFTNQHSESVQLVDGEFYFIRMRVEGANAFARVWKVSEEEPATWQLQAVVVYATAGYFDLNPGFFGTTAIAIDSLSAGLAGYTAQNNDDLLTTVAPAAITIVPGAQRLTIFEDDDITPIIGIVDPRDGRIIQATVSNHPQDPRPYLNPVDEHSETQLALIEGNASVGQLNFSLGDKRTNPIDQKTGWFTALLNKGIMNHRAIFQQMTAAGDWQTLIDGVCGPPALRTNLVEFSGSIKALRERERDVRVFTKTFFSILPVGLPDGYGLITEQIPDFSAPDIGLFVDDFDSDVAGTLLQNHLNRADPPIQLWQRHPNFANDVTLSYTGRARPLAVPANYFVNTAPASADYEILAKLWKRSATVGTMGVSLRMNGATSNYYYFYYDDNLDRWALDKNVAGAITALANFPMALELDRAYSIRFRAVGTLLRCYVDNVLVISVVDASLAAIGFAGMGATGAAGTEGTGLQLDDYRVNDLTTAAAKANVNTGLLVKPVTPLKARYTKDLNNPNKGVFAIDWRGSGFSDGQWEQYSSDNWEILQPFTFASSVFSTNSGAFEMRHQGVLVRWTDQWELGKPTRWRNLRDMKLGDTELFLTNQSNWLILGAQGDFKLTHVQGQADDTTLLPDDGQVVYFEVISERAPTDEQPLYLTENIGRLAQRIYDGEFRDVDSPRIAYDIGYMVKFILETPVSNVKITAPWENMWDAMAQHLYKPFGYVPAVNGRGEIVPKKADLPDPKIDVPVLDDNSIEEAHWIEGSEDLVTVGEFIYQRDFLAPQDPDVPRSDYERLREREVRLVRIAASYVLHKEHKVTYEQDTIRSVTLSNMGAGEIAHEVGAQVGSERLRKTITRFSNGADRCSVTAKTSDPNVANLEEGDWRNPQISWLPDKLTGVRGLNRIMQVIQVKDLTPLKRQILFLDAGPYNVATPAATVGTVSSVGSRRITVDVTAVPTVDGAPVTVVLQYSLSPNAPNVDTTDAQWVTFAEDTKVGVKTSQILPLASTAFVRYRTEFPGRRPSAWNLTGAAAALHVVGIPTAVGVTFPGGATTANINFTPPDALVASDVYLRFEGQDPATTALVGTVAPGAGPRTLLVVGLVPGISYVASVRSRDVGTGDQADAVEITFPASGVVTTLKKPILPTPFTFVISPRILGRRFLGGTFGMAVFAQELPSQVEFQMALETGIGTGIYGAYASMVDLVDSVQGDWTIGTNRSIINDRLRRKMRARAVREGATPSGWTDEVVVTPWTSVPLNPVTSYNRQLLMRIEKDPASDDSQMVVNVFIADPAPETDAIINIMAMPDGVEAVLPLTATLIYPTDAVTSDLATTAFKQFVITRPAPDAASGRVTFRAESVHRIPASQAVDVSPRIEFTVPTPTIGPITSENTAWDDLGEGLVHIPLVFEPNTAEFIVYATEAPGVPEAPDLVANRLAHTVLRYEGDTASADDWATEVDISTTPGFYRRIIVLSVGPTGIRGEPFIDTILCADVGVPPAAPPNTFAVVPDTITGHTRMTLTWVNGDVLAETRIWRNGIMLKRVAPGVTTLVDLGVSTDRAYDYKIQHIRNNQTSRFVTTAGIVSGTPTLVAPSWAGGYPANGGYDSFTPPANGLVQIRVVNPDPLSSTNVYMNGVSTDTGVFTLVASIPPGLSDYLLNSGDLSGADTDDERWFYLQAVRSGFATSPASAHVSARFGA